MQCLLEFSNGFLDVIVSLMIVIILNGCHETLSNRDTTHLCSYPNIMSKSGDSSGAKTERENRY